jgi:hypothetical protein
MILGGSWICSLEALRRRADFGQHDVRSSIERVYISVLEEGFVDSLCI